MTSGRAESPIVRGPGERHALAAAFACFFLLLCSYYLLRPLRDAMGAQAGLSWNTILNKRLHYRKVYDGFDPEKVARYDGRKARALLQDPGIVRNRAKVASSIRNAICFLTVRKEFGTFDAYLWRFVDGRPVRNAWRRPDEVPATSAVSDALSRDLRRRGFSFVGSTNHY